MLLNRAYEKRLERRQTFNDFIEPETVKIYSSSEKKYINFGCLKSFSKLFQYHFLKNKIPLLNKNNCNSPSLETEIEDFRDGNFYKSKFKNFILNNNVILYQLYMDGTKIGNKKKSKEIVNIYLTFINDNLINLPKKFIYNISFITKDNLKKITLDKYLYFIISKFKLEVENGILLENRKIYCFLYSFIGDNKEIYGILNLKVSFSKTIFSCKCCDVNTKENVENTIKNMDLYTLKNNDFYFYEILERRKGILNEKFFNATSLSNVFLLKKIDYLYTFPLYCQHCEFEGEIQRSIILLFLNISNFELTNEFSQMIFFLKKIIKINNVQNFFKNINLLKNKIFPNVFNLKYCDITLTSGEAMLIFSIIPFFFNDLFNKFTHEFYIRCYLMHKKYIDIIMEDKLKRLNLMKFNILQKKLLKFILRIM